MPKVGRGVAEVAKGGFFADTFADSSTLDRRKPLIVSHFQVVPVVGLEPTRLLKVPGF